MSTIPYPQTTSRPQWPLVTFAQKIGKNTAEFTAKDMRKFCRWTPPFSLQQQGQYWKKKKVPPIKKEI